MGPRRANATRAAIVSVHDDCSRCGTHFDDWQACSAHEAECTALDEPLRVSVPFSANPGGRREHAELTLVWYRPLDDAHLRPDRSMPVLMSAADIVPSDRP